MRLKTKTGGFSRLAALAWAFMSSHQRHDRTQLFDIVITWCEAISRLIACPPESSGVAYPANGDIIPIARDSCLSIIITVRLNLI